MSGHELRIGDREREAAVSALGEHYVAGRLTKEEYEERSAVAFRARTNSDLAPLFVDLPSLRGPSARPVQPARPTAPVRPGGAPRSGFRFPFLPLLLVIAGVAILTEGWPVLLLLGLLWWVFIFRCAHRVVHRSR